MIGRLRTNTVEKRNLGYIQQCIVNLFAISEDQLVEVIVED